jgi:hypothetical protein
MNHKKIIIKGTTEQASLVVIHLCFVGDVFLEPEGGSEVFFENVGLHCVISQKTVLFASHFVRKILRSILGWYIGCPD